MSDLIRYDDLELDECSLKKLKSEINESDVDTCLDNLKTRLRAIEDLNPCLSEKFLLGYLRVCKFDCKKAYERILRYYEERRNLPDIFGDDYLPSTVKHVETARTVHALPYRAKDNCAILMMKRGEYDPSQLSYETIVKGLCMVGDVIQLHPVYQLTGSHFIMDLKCSSWSSWSEYTPSRLRLISRLVQKTIAVRIQGIHIINAPTIYYILYSMFHPLFSTKLRNRLFVHKNFESLHSHIEPERLPKEYDGHIEHSDLINVFERLYKMEDFFEFYSKYGYRREK